MNNEYCSECKRGVLIRQRGNYETVFVDQHGKTLPLRVPGMTWLECNECGEVVIESDSMSIIEAARREAMGRLTPEQIREFRTRSGRTQAAMSDLLGIGQKTYCRWESGAYIQSEGFDRFLRLLIECDDNLVLLQEIATKKDRRSRDATEISELSEKFSYLKDVQGLIKREQAFVEMFIHGELQTV